MFPFPKKIAVGERSESLPESNEGPPDSHRPSGLCPRCNKQSSFEVIGSLPVTFDGSYSLSREGIKTPGVLDRVSSLICRHCEHGVVVVEGQWIGEISERARRQADQKFSGGLISYRGFHWWPLPNVVLSSDVPTDIAGAYSEACLCLEAGCPRASVVMARRTLEAIAVDKGQSTGNLASRLSTLSSNGVLHPSLTEWAKEVRLIGNAGAHFDPMNAASTEDARDLVKFIRELLSFLYEMPAELARRRAAP